MSNNVQQLAARVPVLARLRGAQTAASDELDGRIKDLSTEVRARLRATPDLCRRVATLHRGVDGAAKELARFPTELELARVTLAGNHEQSRAALAKADVSRGDLVATVKDALGCPSDIVGVLRAARARQHCVDAKQKLAEAHRRATDITSTKMRGARCDAMLANLATLRDALVSKTSKVRGETAAAVTETVTICESCVKSEAATCELQDRRSTVSAETADIASQIERVVQEHAKLELVCAELNVTLDELAATVTSERAALEHAKSHVGTQQSTASEMKAAVSKAQCEHDDRSRALTEARAGLEKKLDEAACNRDTAVDAAANATRTSSTLHQVKYKALGAAKATLSQGLSQLRASEQLVQEQTAAVRVATEAYDADAARLAALREFQLSVAAVEDAEASGRLEIDNFCEQECAGIAVAAAGDRELARLAEAEGVERHDTVAAEATEIADLLDTEASERDTVAAAVAAATRQAKKSANTKAAAAERPRRAPKATAATAPRGKRHAASPLQRSPRPQPDPEPPEPVAAKTAPRRHNPAASQLFTPLPAGRAGGGRRRGVSIPSVLSMSSDGSDAVRLSLPPPASAAPAAFVALSRGNRSAKTLTQNTPAGAAERSTPHHTDVPDGSSASPAPRPPPHGSTRYAGLSAFMRGPWPGQAAEPRPPRRSDALKQRAPIPVPTTPQAGADADKHQATPAQQRVSGVTTGSSRATRRRTNNAAPATPQQQLPRGFAATPASSAKFQVFDL